MSDDLDYDALDPGIRDTVRLLREHGFETTDSGDGVSKSAEWYASGEAMPFPHVVAQLTPATLLAEADRMHAVLGPEWTIEATYLAGKDFAYVLASKGAQP